MTYQKFIGKQAIKAEMSEYLFKNLVSGILNVMLI